MSDSYQLLDFGDGRKLESVGGRIIDRPSPAAEGSFQNAPELWETAVSRFDVASRSWDHRQDWTEPTLLRVEAERPFSMPFRPTPFGHIGVFPEQADNWRWLQQTSPKIEGSAERSVDHQGLNLFAYTGASTMAMVAMGIKVAHVDAAKPNVQTAREVARQNGWEDAPIRYLVDDAAKFTAREVRRGNRYHTIVMDPPAYGHGPTGKAWRLERDLPLLIDDGLELLRPKSFRLLITGHSSEMDQSDVSNLLTRKLDRSRLGRAEYRMETGRMSLCDLSGRKLDAGFFIRCCSTDLIDSK